MRIPIWFAGIPGHKNSFSDWLSHCFEEMVARAEKSKKAKTVSTCVMALVDVVMDAPARELERDLAVKGLEIEQVSAGDPTIFDVFLSRLSHVGARHGCCCCCKHGAQNVLDVQVQSPCYCR